MTDDSQRKWGVFMRIGSESGFITAGGVPWSGTLSEANAKATERRIWMPIAQFTVERLRDKEYHPIDRIDAAEGTGP